VIASDPNGVIASNNRQFGRVRTVSNDAEIIALGEKAHAGFPECAVLGVDVIRESGTGKLYVMEVNPEGFTWHFSSSLSKNTFTAEHVRDLYAQFGALDRVARLLIEKTRAEGS
jgi:glutathione synthase/RimK-type ligase-like ATP-grasp enzyme